MNIDLLKLAWRNLWGNRRRTWITLGALAWPGLLGTPTVVAIIEELDAPTATGHAPGPAPKTRGLPALHAPPRAACRHR